MIKSFHGMMNESTGAKSLTIKAMVGPLEGELLLAPQMKLARADHLQTEN